MRIIGCGNRQRGDDGAGVLVVERLRELGVGAAGVSIKSCSGETAELLDSWGSDDDVIVVDAVVTGASVGTIHRWDQGMPPCGRPASASTHGLGVGEAIGLAQALGRSPRSLRIYGIEGKHFDQGSRISPEVRQAVENVAQQIGAGISAKEL
jgi:hydrogenase maturation protease